MALLKSTNFKGYDYEYWAITNLSWSKDSNITSAVVSLFKDQAIRELSLNNDIKEMAQYFYFEGNLDRSQIYEKLKESVMINEIETNPLVGAIDV